MEADAERPASLTCRSCGAPIVWVETPGGQRVPLDAEPVETVGGGLYAIDWPTGPYQTPRGIHRPALHLTHFATCPNAAQHRKR